MATVDKLPMLAEGHQYLVTTLRRLKEEERPEVVLMIEEARAHGDLSENAEYHAAKERQGQRNSELPEQDRRLFPNSTSILLTTARYFQCSVARSAR